MSQSIFGATAVARVQLCKVPLPAGSSPPSKAAEHIAAATTLEGSPTSKVDAALLAVLEAALAPGETVHAGFQRKEAELRAAFASLSVLESRALHARLAHPRSGDALAAAFARLTIERRMRLLAFIADARRREAVAFARR